MALPVAAAQFVTVLLLLVVLVATGRSSGTDGGCFATLVGCAPPASATGNATAFRTSLAPLLAALPDAAAAEGYASLRSQSQSGPGRGRDRAHALGLCFGGGGASGCHACLSAAVAAASEGCANDTRRAAVWRDGCLLAYYNYNGGGASSASDGGARSCPDNLEQTLADLAMALAQPKGRSLWRKAQSVLFFILAAIGTVTVVVVLCFLTGCYLLAETIARTMAAAGPQAGIAAAARGEGLAVYIAGTNGQAPVWLVATQFRLY